MCGIAGFWQSKRTREHPCEVLNRMGAALKHRGPDDSGVFYQEDAGLGLAFRRLSILDLSSEGHQPMFSASGRYVMVFNGEVYNFEEIRNCLDPHRWRGGSDTEVMLQAIERWGLEASLHRFVGMFAIALWDVRERKLHLVRDRLGIKPIYYGSFGGTFAFGSELKAIRQLEEFVPEIDRNTLALYMRHSYVPSPHCIYKGLHKLKPGCMLTLDCASGTPIISKYWSVEETARNGLESPLHVDDSEAVHQLHELLRHSVRLRMISDVPLGAFLSGGVDSSTVVALMQEQSRRPVSTFTIGFCEQGYNEAADAKRVAEHLGTEHTELYLSSKDALGVIPLLPNLYDEPFSDPSQIPTYLVSKLARQYVTVSLSGDGGDELFGGYNRYKWTRKIWGLNNLIPRGARRTAASIIRAVSPRRFDAVFDSLAPILPKRFRHSTPGDKTHKLADFLAMDGPQAVYYSALSHWRDPEGIVLGSMEPDTVRGTIQQAFGSVDIEDAMMLADLLYYLPDDILTKVDRASMAVSLEVRVPLLDHRIVEFAWRLPALMKIRKTTTKWILRRVLHKYVPQNLVERPKMGFGVPIDGWIRGELKDWAEDLLSARSLSAHNLFDVQQIRDKWDQHVSGVRNWQYLLWDVLVFQSWFNGSQPIHSFHGTETSQTATGAII
jgi:asparagine synthase (glutamine-hydrolysing)